MLSLGPGSPSYNGESQEPNACNEGHHQRQDDNILPVDWQRIRFMRPIFRPDNTCPMHARYTACEYHCSEAAFPNLIGEILPESKEDAKSDSAGGNGDDDGADNESNVINAGIVGNTSVSEIMHSGNTLEWLVLSCVGPY